jgi:transcriptional regulator with XRE-family HTH domain
MHGFATLKRMTDTPWARYVRRISGGAGGSEIEKKTGIRQSNISRWLNEGTIPQPAQAAKFAQSYGANVLEAFVAAGFLTEEEAGIPPRPGVDFYAIVDEDPNLSQQSKIHLKNQYGLLRAASAHGRAAQARELIENDPELDDETKRRLLSHFDSARMDVVFSTTAMVVEHPFPDLSEPSDRPDLAIAAHDEDEPIAGEQESPTDA